MSHLTVTKTEGGRARYGGGTWWHVMHTPTGAAVGKYRLKRTAVIVASEIERAFGHILSIADPCVLTARMKEVDPELCRWIVVADSCSLADYREHKAAEKLAAELLERARAAWTGQAIHFVAGGRYGKQATIVSVESFDAGQRMLCCVLAWNERHSVLGASVFLDDIARGPAPDSMPWTRFSSTWRARVGGGVYVIGRICLPAPDDWRYGLWTEDVPEGRDRLSEALCDFGYRSLETAQAAALAHARGRE